MSKKLRQFHGISDLRDRHRLVIRIGPVSYTHLDVYKRQVLTYINDGNSSSIYDSRAHFSTLNGGVYSVSSQIADPTGFSGYGDTSVSLSGTDSFAAAAWVRMGTEIPNKNAADDVTLEEQNLLMNSTEIVVSVYDLSLIHI